MPATRRLTPRAASPGGAGGACRRRARCLPRSRAPAAGPPAPARCSQRRRLPGRPRRGAQSSPSAASAPATSSPARRPAAGSASPELRQHDAGTRRQDTRRAAGRRDARAHLLGSLGDGENGDDPDGDDDGVPRFADHPMLAHQARIVLRNCGIIDPEDVDHYLARGGYPALERCLDLTRQDVVDLVKLSGLRGRGGRASRPGRSGRSAARPESVQATSSATPTKATPARS